MLRGFNLSRNKSLQTLETTAESIDAAGNTTSTLLYLSTQLSSIGVLASAVCEAVDTNRKLVSANDEGRASLGVPTTIQGIPRGAQRTGLSLGVLGGRFRLYGGVRHKKTGGYCEGGRRIR